MAYKADELLNYVPENSPYNIDKTQRVTVLKRDLSHLNRAINDFIGVETKETAISLNAIVEKLNESALNLMTVTNGTLIEEANKEANKQHLAKQLVINLAPDDKFDVNTFTHHIKVNKDDITSLVNGQIRNPVGLNEVDLELTINTSTGFVQQQAQVEINQNNFDNINNKTILDFTTVTDEAGETHKVFGAQSAELTVALVESEIDITNRDITEDDGTMTIIPTGEPIGFSKVIIKPVIEPEYTLSASDFDAKEIKTITADDIAVETENALGIKKIIIPPISDVSTLNIKFDNEASSELHVINVNSSEEISLAEQKVVYPINILGRTDIVGGPRNNISIDYIIENDDFTTKTVTDYIPATGDIVYEKTIENEIEQKVYYVFNGETWTSHEDITKPLVLYYRHALGEFSNQTENTKLEIRPTDSAIGIKGTDIILPGTVDYTFNIASNLLKTEETESDNIIFNFTDETVKLNKLIIPKVTAKSTTIKADIIGDAIKRKKTTLPIAVEDSTFERPVVVNALTIELPENITGSTKNRDLAIFETQISNVKTTNNTSLEFNADNQIVVEDNEATEDDLILHKTCCLINRDQKQRFTLNVTVDTDSTITVYQLNTPAESVRNNNSFTDTSKLFSFKATGPKIINTDEYSKAPNYRIEFSEFFEYIPVFNTTATLPEETDPIENHNTTNINLNSTVLEDFKVWVDNKELSKKEILDLFTYISTNTISESLYYTAVCAKNDIVSAMYNINNTDGVKLELYQNDDTTVAVGNISTLNLNEQFIATNLVYDGQTYSLEKQSKDDSYIGSYYFYNKDNVLNIFTISDHKLKHNGNTLCDYTIFNNTNVLCYNADGIIGNAFNLGLPDNLKNFGISFTNQDGIIKLDKIMLQGLIYSPIKLNYIGTYEATNIAVPKDSFTLVITENEVLFNPAKILKQ